MKIGYEYSWKTIIGDEYSGVVVDVDSNVLYVKCLDGVIRPVET